jgi:hypothetical protein
MGALEDRLRRLEARLDAMPDKNGGPPAGTESRIIRLLDDLIERFEYAQSRSVGEDVIADLLEESRRVQEMCDEVEAHNAGRDAKLAGRWPWLDQLIAENAEKREQIREEKRILEAELEDQP